MFYMSTASMQFDTRYTIDSETAKPQVVVTIVAICRCPRCGKTLKRVEQLDEEALNTGNTTQRAGYWAKQMREGVAHMAKERLWTDEMCGACRVTMLEGTT